MLFVAYHIILKTSALDCVECYVNLPAESGSFLFQKWILEVNPLF